VAVGKLYVAGEVLCRWRGAMSLARYVAVASCAAVGSGGCLGGAWHFMVLAHVTRLAFGLVVITRRPACGDK
jgi:hypothetical protein